MVYLKRHESALYAASFVRAKRGFSLVEVIVGTSLIFFSITGLVAVYAGYLRVGFKTTDTVKAVLLLQEGVEGVTLLRDESWNSFASLTALQWYYLGWNGTKWFATTTATTTDSHFVRTFMLENVYRAQEGHDIVSASSTIVHALDADTKKLTVRVTALGVAKEATTYLTNLFE